MDLRELVAAESVLRDREPVVVVVVSVVTRVAMSGVDVVNVIAVGDRDVPAAVGMRGVLGPAIVDRRRGLAAIPPARYTLKWGEDQTSRWPPSTCRTVPVTRRSSAVKPPPPQCLPASPAAGRAASRPWPASASLSSHGIQPLVDRSLQLQCLRPAISTVAACEHRCAAVEHCCTDTPHPPAPRCRSDAACRTRPTHRLRRGFRLGRTTSVTRASPAKCRGRDLLRNRRVRRGGLWCWADFVRRAAAVGPVGTTVRLGRRPHSEPGQRRETMSKSIGVQQVLSALEGIRAHPPEIRR